MDHHFRPLRDRVLLRRVEVEGKHPAGIIIPDTGKEKPVAKYWQSVRGHRMTAEKCVHSS